MTDLERRALLGNLQAQEECTRKGIVLPCPCCGGKPFFTCNTKGTPPEVIKVEWSYLIVCENCRLSSGIGPSFTSILKKWNTRPAPPIGRCEDCISWRGKPGDENAHCKDCDGVMEADNFCRNFEPREK